MANIRAAKQFVQQWKGRGDEKQETQSFWIQLLDQVFEDHHYNKDILFEQTADKIEGGKYFKDVVIFRNTDHCVLVEQKGSKYELDEKEPRHGLMLTPFEQAKEYDDKSGYNDKARWIITCNFREFWIYDMTKTGKELYTPVAKLKLEELPKHLDWLVMLEPEKMILPHFSEEVDVSVKAGELVGILYDDLHKNYINPDDPESLRQLNILCVRIVFCLYAEDAGLFDRNNRKMFHDYLAQFDAQHMRKALAALFKVLDQKPEERDPYLADDDPMLAAFPYVNGGLFEGDVVIPPFTDETVDILINKESLGFDWSKISPTIFGAVFESTLNQETRRSGGMHYTSVENIHKVIDPLFLDDLKTELNEILELKTPNIREKRLIAFQKKLSEIRCLDPACGSGNFLTESYLSLRRLENEALKTRFGKNISMGFEEASVNPIQVSIQQFYGIEINDFAAAVAKTALWIAEAQMFEETQSILNSDKEFLPLQTFSNIHEGNALRINWNDVVPANELNYIMGNPPFVGARWMSRAQKSDIATIFFGIKDFGNLDYVTAWYKKAADYIKNTMIRCAFVSTNTITQGEQPAIFWKPLFEDGIHIDFAYRTFIWDSEASVTAHVHCVIVGFSRTNNIKHKILYDESGVPAQVNNINAYLIDADDVFIASQKHPICNVPEIGIGNKPIDGGFYLFEKKEMDDFIKVEPMSAQYFHPWYGSREFINQKPRYCLYLGNCSPAELRSMPHCMERVNEVRQYRLSSTSIGTRKLANTPTKFHVSNFPKGDYIVIPQVSSERRRYIPMGYMDESVLCSDKVRIMPTGTLYHFGVLESTVHMSWVRAICGRLKSDYSYTVDHVYNNFPWPNANCDQIKMIERTAQGVIDARSLFPNSSLADLYDPLTMPMELRKAHEANDKAVMDAYGFSKDMSEADIVAELMKRYQKLTGEASIK